MVFKNNQTNNTNKPENFQKQNSIIKKIGKKENYYVNESTNKYIKEGDEILMSKFVYSGRVPKPDIIGEILKRLEKIDLKLDNIDERITNIEQVQKLQGEEIKEIKEVQKAQGEKINNIELIQKAQSKEIKEIKENQKIQGEKIDKIDERLTKLENKVDNVIILNNLKIE
ncbi:MAG: hypothetical protein LBF02_01950 [Mycoplasmataceae bacterium]|jgi:tetrahydromethanopterin S-methyltransferase subunit G|nr:hypothetical protein [Mycoplasmataceae bacterium]